jgi:hypothetical protein
MTTVKRVLCEQRLRHIPAQFSWIDQRLVFEGHLGRLDAHAAALYLFLLTVADAQGLSYWGDARVARLLGVAPAALARAREDLVRAGLIVYERPLYQVLALDTPGLGAAAAHTAARNTETPAASSPTSPMPTPAPTPALASDPAPAVIDRDAVHARLAQLRVRLSGGPDSAHGQGKR